MLANLWNAFYFVIALGILVTIHEYGHFWVARKFGVKVLTFSIGFGKAIWQRKGKDGVNYVIAAIPLGGYVKMLDEREGEVASQDLGSAFNRKSVWIRMAIVVAGPVANFLLAIVLYWWMFMLGITGYSTEMSDIPPNSIAAQAGLVDYDRVVAVDGEPVFLLQDMNKAIANRIGDTGEMLVDVINVKTERTRNLKFDLKNWQIDSSRPELLETLGFNHKSRSKALAAEIDVPKEGTAAAVGGLRKGDTIVKFDGSVIDSWQELVTHIEPNPGKEITLEIIREGELKDISVVIGTRKQDGKQFGQLGIMPNGYLSFRQGGVAESLVLALDETKKMILLSVNLFRKLLTGDISTKSLSGPFSIAEGAGNSARGGFVFFISFVAMISVNLGFINLLPIPLLDGGHLLFYSIEAVKGKPLSEKVQEMGMQIGLLMVVALMSVAIFNDLSRF